MYSFCWCIDMLLVESVIVSTRYVSYFACVFIAFFSYKTLFTSQSCLPCLIGLILFSFRIVWPKWQCVLSVLNLVKFIKKYECQLLPVDHLKHCSFSCTPFEFHFSIEEEESRAAPPRNLCIFADLFLTVCLGDSSDSSDSRHGYQKSPMKLHTILA